MKKSPTPAAPLDDLLSPVNDPAWRTWLERLLRDGEPAPGPPPPEAAEVGVIANKCDR